MQKLSGTSLGKNNKSCRIFYRESMKIEFAFLWMFYGFLRNLQESTKWLYYLRITFARVPGKFQILMYMPLVYENHPGKNGKLAIESPGTGRRRPCRITARWRPEPVGRGWQRPCGSPRARFACSEGVGRAAGGVYRGSRWRPPLELLLRRASGRGRAVGGAVSS
jgi:hypothetical protein